MEKKQKRSLYDQVIFIITFIVLSFLLVLVVLDIEENMNQRNTTSQTNYEQTLNYCNYNIALYINQTPDYSTCETQEECELKQLKFGILQQQSFQCMNESWEMR